MGRGLRCRWIEPSASGMPDGWEGPPLVGRLLAQRGIQDQAAADDFLKAPLTGVHDPELLPNITEVAQAMLAELDNTEGHPLDPRRLRRRRNHRLHHLGPHAQATPAGSFGRDPRSRSDDRGLRHLGAQTRGHRGRGGPHGGECGLWNHGSGSGHSSRRAGTHSVGDRSPQATSR